jgi:hypothetical protein
VAGAANSPSATLSQLTNPTAKSEDQIKAEIFTKTQETLISNSTVSFANTKTIAIEEDSDAPDSGTSDGSGKH